MEDVVEIFTDGACRGNPGPGGWGVFLRYKGVDKSLNGAKLLTTNNQMELQAAIEGIKAITRPCKIILTTDSNYVKDGISKWIYAWKKNNWKNSKKEPVKNAELWKELDELRNSHEIQWQWVKGHSGHIENEIADKLANEAIDKLLMEQ